MIHPQELESAPCPAIKQQPKKEPNKQQTHPKNTSLIKNHSTIQNLTDLKFAYFKKTWVSDQALHRKLLQSSPQALIAGL